jgi:hypothetical protein
MDNHQLRAILLKLQDRLCDNDRKRLHFFFGNDVPRQIRDDPSLGDTLSRMESPFDQDKISEEDFTFLFKAFDGRAFVCFCLGGGEVPTRTRFECQVFRRFCRNLLMN